MTATERAEAEALMAIARLARKGAYAVPVVAGPDEAQTYAVFSPRNGFARALTRLPGAAIACAQQRGWLEAEPASGRLRLAVAGLKALRRARSAAAAPAPVSPRRAAQPAAPQPQRVPPERPLAWLRRRKDKDGQPLITEAQFAAGERLAGDFWHGQLTPRVTANWSLAAPGRRLRRGAPGVGVEMKDSVVSARERINRALAAVGPELAAILVDVCCHEVGLEAAGDALGWPQRAAKVVLQLALTRLARHYGLIAPEPPPYAQLRHWGDEGYRPDMETWR